MIKKVNPYGYKVEISHGSELSYWLTLDKIRDSERRKYSRLTRRQNLNKKGGNKECQAQEQEAKKPVGQISINTEPTSIAESDVKADNPEQQEASQVQK